MNLLSHELMRLLLKAKVGARRGKLVRILMLWRVSVIMQYVGALLLLMVVVRLKVWRGLGHGVENISL
jgi:hypothetical protein